MSPARALKVAGSGYSGAWRERLWAAMRELREFTTADIERATGTPRRLVLDYLTALERAKHVERLSLERLRLVRDTGVEAPMLRRDGRELSGQCVREALWRTMKLLGTFSARDLAIHASTERCPVSERDAVAYLRPLVQAGYLATQPAGARKATFRFIASRNTGPRPPLVRQVLQVYDANEDQVAWQAGGES